MLKEPVPAAARNEWRPEQDRANIYHSGRGAVAHQEACARKDKRNDLRVEAVRVEQPR